MNGILDRLQDFSAWIARGKIALPEVIAIPPDQCVPLGSVGVNILKDRDYFGVTINELFLSNARVGWATYDPMVVATTNFLYNDKRISVPSIVGPTLLEQKGRKVPQGVLLQDTTVAGPYPYRGGPVAISLAFYRMRHRDYAKDLLRLVESVSTAVGPAADMGLLSKVGGALIGGLDDLLGMGETEPIAGHRIELSPLGPGGFRTCYSALIEGHDSPSLPSMRVEGGRLKTSNESSTPERYAAANYILYSLSRTDRRDDERALPFFSLYERALTDAARGGDEHWDAAKATFGELWQEMILSPDLTRVQAKELFEQWKTELLEARATGQNTKLMSVGQRRPEDERTRGVAGVLRLQ